MQNLLHHVYDLLKQDERLLSTEWDLLKNKIQELAYKLDERLIEMLLSDATMKEKFFIVIKDVVVFDQKKFVQFISNKEFLPDSYTAFKNKIGLTDDRGNFVNESGDVVLERPYKDGVLAGWQDKEDVKRDEIFYNEVLWSDQIDRLLDPKVFTNFKKYTADWEQSVQDFNRGEDGVIKDNLIIKGNNLLALHSLKKQFAGKVKLIYIDPPYNTGNDGFKYNDKFNHSTWLTFMKNRLQVARELLKDDGVIFVQCDDNEQAYLKVLMDEVFGRENFVADFIWNHRKSSQNDIDVSLSHNYTVTFAKNRSQFALNPLEIDDSKFFNPDNDPRGEWVADPFDAPNIRPNLTYIIINPNTGEKFLPPQGRCWRTTKEKFEEFLKDNRIIFGKTGKSKPQLKRFKFEAEKKGTNSFTIWDGSDVGTATEWTKELMKIMDGNKVFATPKPEKLLQRIIKISTNPWDIVLDYHLWSGTTCAVAHKMWRQYIGVEQMDYIETIAVERMNKVIAWEQWWISKSVDWNWWWEFIYMEIAQNNLKFIHTIQNTQTSQELVSLYHQLKESSFINYKVDITSIQQGVEEFVELSLEDQKRLLIELIDKNTLYINYSEIVDRNYKISDKDKDLNNKFYQ